MSKRICFPTYEDWEAAFKALDAESCQELILAVFDYGLRKNMRKLSPMAQLAMNMIKPLMDRDWEKYDKIVERNKTNSKNAGRPKKEEKIQRNPNKSTGLISNPLEPTGTQSDPIINNKIINNEIKDKEEHISFDVFWNLYDKKVDRGACEPKWNKLSQADRKAAIEYIPKYKEAEPRKSFRKNPETFLNRRAWENELIFREEDNGINTGKIQKTGYEWKV